jgi:hypothetical protein
MTEQNAPKHYPSGKNAKLTLQRQHELEQLARENFTALLNLMPSETAKKIAHEEFDDRLYFHNVMSLGAWMDTRNKLVELAGMKHAEEIARRINSLTHPFEMHDPKYQDIKIAFPEVFIQAANATLNLRADREPSKGETEMNARLNGEEIWRIPRVPVGYDAKLTDEQIAYVRWLAQENLTKIIAAIPDSEKPEALKVLAEFYVPKPHQMTLSDKVKNVERFDAAVGENAKAAAVRNDIEGTAISRFYVCGVKDKLCYYDISKVYLDEATRIIHEAQDGLKKSREKAPATKEADGHRDVSWLPESTPASQENPASLTAQPPSAKMPASREKPAAFR